VPTEDIPAVIPACFTPHWIRAYWLENSLGRLWLLNRPASKLRRVTCPTTSRAEPRTDFLKITKARGNPPARSRVGTGNMPAHYACDLLSLNLPEEGLNAPSEIPALILRQQPSTGLEICPRAAHARRAWRLCSRRRESSRRFFQSRAAVRAADHRLQNVQFEGDEADDYIEASPGSSENC